MSPLKTGDRVKIKNREMTAADVKSGMFYDYFRGLTGAVEHVYEDKTICIRVDLDSLPVDVKKRHIEVQETIRQNWLDGLGQEQRSKLSEEDSRLTLSYNILVDAADVEVTGKAKPAPRAAAPVKPAKPGDSRSASAARKTSKSDQPQRRTQDEIEKAEKEHLEKLLRRTKTSE